MAVARLDGEKSTTVVVDSPENHVVEHLEGSKTSSNEVLPRQLPPVKQMSFWECIKTYRYASLVCFLAAIGALSDGYQIQMSGSIVALDGFIDTFGKPNADGVLKLDPQHLALWGSLKNVAAMFGAFIGSYPADKFGRTWLIFAVQIFMIGGCILEQFATEWTHWLGARLLDGFSIGLAQCCINVYISEVAPTGGRGALIGLVQLCYTLGAFLSAVSLNIVTNQAPGLWRNAVLSQFAVSGVALIAWWFLPESPRWHCVKGHEQKCKDILYKLNGKVEGYNVDEEYQRMLMEIENVEINKSITGGGTYFDVFRGTNFRRLVISFLPWHWQVAIGVPIIGTYSAYFFDMAGLENPFIGTVAINVVNIFMLLFCLYLVEKLGRRRLLLTFSIISICSLLIMGGVLRTDGPAVGPVLITFACIWNIGFSLSAGAMGYIYVAETSTLRLRAKTAGVAIFFIQGMATVYVYIAPIMLNAPALGMSNTVFFWAGTGTAVYILVAFLVPETKGRSYTDLDELFERKIPAWKFAETKTRADLEREEAENRGTA